MANATDRARASRLRPLGRMLAARVLGTLLVLLVLSIIIFAMMYLAPGDIVKNLLGNRPATEEAVAAVRAQYRLDEPVVTQYLLWLRDLLTGDLGESIRLQVPVADAIGARVGITAALCGIAFLLAVIVAVPVGVASAVKAGGWMDRIAPLHAAMRGARFLMTTNGPASSRLKFE